MATTDTHVNNPIINVLTKSQYQGIASPSASEFYLITDDSPITAGSGLTAVVAGGETMISHTNSITAVTTQALYPITIDAQGHITSVGTATTGGTSYTHPSATAHTAAAVKVGNDALGHVVIGSAITPSDIGAASSTHTHSKADITDFPTSMTPSSHTHGNIQNGGTLQTNDVTIATGDKLVITDSSDSHKVARASISFNTSSTTSFLRNDGTWATPQNTTYTLTTTGTGNAITAIGLSGTTITATKGSTFAVSTHTHDYAASSHSHGNITNAGAITTTATIATGDKLVITDSSDSSKLKASSISFGTTTSSFLSNDGTWKQPAKYGSSLPASGDFVGQIFVLTE